MGKATFGGNGQYELIDNENGTFEILDTVSGNSTTITNGKIPSNSDIEFEYDPGMVEWEAGLTDEEVGRINLEAGEELVIERIEFQQKGGGSSTSAGVDVRDVTAATTVGSQSLGGVRKDPGTTGTGNTVIIRLTNNTGAVLNANPRIIGYILGA